MLQFAVLDPLLKWHLRNHIRAVRGLKARYADDRRHYRGHDVKLSIPIALGSSPRFPEHLAELLMSRVRKALVQDFQRSREISANDCSRIKPQTRQNCAAKNSVITGRQ